MAVLPAAPAVAAGAGTEATADHQATELAQLRFPRLRMPSVPRMPRVFAITPERRALLNTIRYAEGTWKDGEDKGYRIMYGGGQFQDLSRHPERVIVKRYTSAAAGAYQFLPKTWKGVAKELKLSSFEPRHQDQAALHLVERRGALKEIDRKGLTRNAMAKLAPEWASFPTWTGRSAYGQPVKSPQDLASFYSSNLRQLRNQLGA